MTELTAAQADALEILSESPAARTATELARLLDESPYEIEDTLAWLKRHRFIVGVAAWQLTTGATYMLGSTHQLTDIELDVLHELSLAGGVRTIDDLARRLGVAAADLSDTVHWLSGNGYLQPVTAWRRKPVYY